MCCVRVCVWMHVESVYSFLGVANNAVHRSNMRMGMHSSSHRSIELIEAEVRKSCCRSCLQGYVNQNPIIEPLASVRDSVRAHHHTWGHRHKGRRSVMMTETRTRSRYEWKQMTAAKWATPFDLYVVCRSLNNDVRNKWSMGWANEWAHTYTGVQLSTHGFAMLEAMLEMHCVL